MLLLSTSPRMTWLWAPDAHTAQRVREITGGRAAVRHGETLPLITDIGIGVEALTACEKLAETGFTFTWHDSQHPLNRAGWPGQLPGMPDGSVIDDTTRTS